MSNESPNIERRLDELAQQVSVLTERLDRLTASFQATSEVADLAARDIVTPQEPVQAPEQSDTPTSEELLSVPMVLSSVATGCFLLVVALILRTLADSNIVNQSLGTVLGVLYATSLVLYGSRRYATGQPFPDLYVACGAFLLLSIVFETHSRFHVMSTLSAYALLSIALVTMVGLGLRLKFTILPCLGILGTSLIAMVLDFPEPRFPVLAAFLLLANGAAYMSSRVPRCGWLRWVVLVITLFFWLFWAAKGRVPLVRGHTPSAELALAWILPGLGIFTAGALAATSAGVLRRAGTIGALEAILPPVAAAGTAVIGLAVVVPYYAAPGPISAAGVGLALVYLLLAAWFAKKDLKGIRAAMSFLAGALILFGAFVPGCTGGVWLALPLWSLTALGIALIPPFERHPYAQSMSHLFQSYVCVMAVVAGFLSVNSPQTFDGALMALALAALCVGHYVLSEKALARFQSHHPDKASPSSFTTILLFCVGLVYLFGAARIVLSAGVSGLQAGDDALRAGESVLINLGALAVAVVGIRLRKGEILAVAVALAAIGACKVFTYDLMRLNGVPLLLSVLSFGITASLGSALWNRWQRSVRRPSGTVS